MMLPNDQVLTVAQMRAAEEALIARGETIDSLMLTAGTGAGQWVYRLAGHASVTVLCGPGNNGGDGYLIAEYLRQRSVSVMVVAPLEPATDAARNARAAFGGDVVSSGDGRSGSVLVDCLFGSGLVRPLEDDLLDELLGLAARHRHLVAIDLPSGMESDSAAMLNAGLPHYDLTICLGAWKYAHWLMPACEGMGERRLVPIGIAERSGDARVLCKPRLSTPAPDAHKYSRGLLGVVGGAMPGAGLLAARAAMHGGAGYVKLLADARPQGVPADLVVETAPLGDALGDQRLSALLCGPGLGRDAAAAERLRSVLARGLPTVLDADALVVEPRLLSDHSAPLIVTPHEGELDNLCRALSIYGASKLELARGLAEKTRVVVIAKGPDTIIAAPGSAAVFCPRASSWLSTAGTGDVLAGLAVSRLAAGASPLDAACEAVWLHGESARLAGPAFSSSDLIRQIPQAVAACL